MAVIMANSFALHPLRHSHLTHLLPTFNFSSIRRNFGKFQSFPRDVKTMKDHSRKSSIVPAIKSQASQVEYAPDTKFYKVEAILRPWRVPHVSKGLLNMGIRGVTVSDVRGFGAQGGLPERHGGSEFSEDNFVAKVKMEIVVAKDQVEEVINTIMAESRTGEIGDGKIFLIPVSDVIRVRTGERGESAERMSGGRYETSLMPALG